MQANKKLYRAGKEHVIGGVCAGFAEYLSIDVVLLRILCIILTLINGVGAVAYVVCLLLIPKNPDHEKLPLSEQKRVKNWGLYVGVAFVVIGLVFGLNNWFHFILWDFDWFFFNFHWNVVWPILIILFGAWFIYRAAQKKDQVPGSEKREFYRSSDQKMIGGVCGGLADYWNIDVTLVRVGYALATLLTAVWLGVIAYIVILLVVKEKNTNNTAHAVKSEEKKASRVQKPKKSVAQKSEKKQDKEGESNE
ncbi:PspC domain-containing protein [candidate division KSB1 bacterium]|nr:PspC domain-containing protein [candidate division KSB1 bacterium]RQW01116.1 MAG: PspC domain-containing protein [candidate division KSB1 bacterium]